MKFFKSFNTRTRHVANWPPRTVWTNFSFVIDMKLATTILKRKNASVDDDDDVAAVQVSKNTSTTNKNTTKHSRRLTWAPDNSLHIGPTTLRADEQRAYALFMLINANVGLGFHEWRGLHQNDRDAYQQRAESWNSLFGQIDFANTPITDPTQ